MRTAPWRGRGARSGQAQAGDTRSRIGSHTCKLNSMPAIVDGLWSLKIEYDAATSDRARALLRPAGASREGHPAAATA